MVHFSMLRLRDTIGTLAYRTILDIRREAVRGGHSSAIGSNGAASMPIPLHLTVSVSRGDVQCA